MWENAKSIKVLSIVLCLLLVVNIIPAGAIDISDLNFELNETSNFKESNSEIVGEIESKRTQTSKVFLCKDNSYFSYISSRPIHYEENGKWKDIDNSLIETKNDKGKKVYKNKLNSFTVEFPDNLTQNDEISYSKDGYILSVKLNNILSNEKEIPAELEDTNSENIDLAADCQNNETEDFKPDKLTSKIEYKNVKRDIDIEYVTIPEGVKENIILNKKPTEQPVLTFTIQSQDLEAELQSDNSIYFYPKNSHESELVFIIPAPVMYDTAISESDKGKGQSEDIKLELTKENSGKYKLTYIPSLEWLQSKDCNYPVTIDPVITTPTTNRNNIKDTFISSAYPSTNYYANQYVYVGYDQDNSAQYGIERGIFRFDNLPALRSGDKISEATLNLYRPYSSKENCYMNVHKLTSAYTCDTVSWNTQPSINSTISDYQNINALGWFSFNVTKIANDWYEGQPNYGLMLKAKDESSSAIDRGFITALNSSDSAYWPVLYIRYYNTTGIEDYWTYHSQDLGRAGVANVNDFTGNLVLTRDDIGVTGNVMPVTISHVYNSNDKDINLGYGKGWRLNYGQKLEYQNIGGIQYVLYSDEDGTRHYFVDKETGQQSPDVWVDESGIDLTLKIYSARTNDHFIISDKSDNTIEFNTNGYPLKIKDSNNNTIQLRYNANNQINQIIDGVGRSYTLNYNGTNGQLGSIVYYGYQSSAVKTVTFSYDGERLSTITDPDTKAGRYYWNSDNSLNKAVDCDNTEVRYTYTQNVSGKPPRVKTVEEFGADGVSAGQKLTFTYNFNETKIVDRDGLSNTYQFNNYGNTVCIIDENNAAQYFEYGAPGGVNANKILTSSKLQKTTVNLLANHNCEGNNAWEQNIEEEGSGTNVCSILYDSSSSYIGNKSIKLQNTTIESTSCIPQMYQTVMLQKNKTYTLSAYVKTSSLSQINGSGAGFKVYIPGCGDLYSDYINYESDWQRLVYTFTVPSSASSDYVNTNIYLCLDNVIGSTWFDCVQLEEGPTPSRYNLVENSSMEYVTSNRPNNWIFARNTASDVIVSNGINKNAYKIEGASDVYKYLYQNVIINGSANQPIVFGAWSKANSIPNEHNYGAYRIYLRVFYTDGTEALACSKFNMNSTEWQYNSSVFIPQKACSNAYIILEYPRNVNSVLFDDAQLYLEEFGESYQYDINGNVTSTSDLAKQQSSFNYDSNNNLSQMIEADGTEFDYTYDSRHNLLSATSDNEVKYDFTYDDYGNPLSSQIGTATGIGDKISTSATYTQNGNYISSVTDARGKTTCYRFNETIGTITNMLSPGDTEDTKTNYTYDSNENLTDVSKTFDGKTYSNTYTYTNDKLTNIQQNGFNYNFEYDVFGNLWKTNVGTQNLITNTYLPNNGLLCYSTYGNGQTVGYTYDSYKRITAKTVGGVEKHQYLYDNEGNLNKYTDNVLNESYTYSYDLIGRLARVKGTNGHSMILNYDNKNRLSDFTNKYGNTSIKTDYSYGITSNNQKPGRIYGIKINDSQKLSYGYDSLARMNNKTISTSQPYLTSYTYENGLGTSSTNFDSTKITNRVVGGDYNGDGKDDIAALYDCGNNQMKIYVWLSNGNSYNNPIVWHDTGVNAFNSSSATGRVVSGDYNGDGKDDIATMYDYGGNNMKIIVFTSTGSLFTCYYGYTTSTYCAANVTNRLVSGDFNGDGKDDIAAMYDYGNATMKIHAFISNGSNFSVSTWLQTNSGVYAASLVSGRMVAGDFNGDGKDDIATMYDYSNAAMSIHTFLSSGSAFSCQTWYTSNSFDASNVTCRMVAGDINDNGKDDITVIYTYGSKNIRLFSFISSGTNFSYTYSNFLGYDANKITGRLVEGDYNDDGKDEIYGLSEYSTNMSKVHEWEFSGSSISDTNTIWDSNKADTVTENQTTPLLKTITNGNDTISYTYDDRGNILTISENGTLKASYTYDLLNQLTREDNAYTGKSIDYAYDLGGNIDNRDEYEYANGARGNLIKSFDYSYDNVWKDKLISYDGKTITYDEIGNPLSFDGRTFTWEAGRQLASTTKDGVTSAYTYNDNGIRTSKTVNGVTTTYYLNGDSVVREHNSTDTIDYYYDENDSLFGFNLNGTDYYYIRNGQNDIIGILDNAGNQVVTYTYDSWGKLVSITGSLASTVGEKNPYRYRGYRYDTETGLFYVGSRYYDPQIGRWINADTTDVLEVDQDSLIENNLYAYCLNNPVNMTDDTGEIAWFVAAAIGGALFDTAAYMIGCAISGEKMTWGGVGKAALVGAITGVCFGAAGKVATKVIKGATTVAKTGKTTVYISKNAKKVVQYVGITDDIARRGAEHLAKKGIRIEPLMKGLSRADARSVEQALIEIHGLSKNGGTLINKINSIAKTNKVYAQSLKRGYELLKKIGYK